MRQILILLTLFLLASTTLGETYTLGSHQVSFNLSENFTAKMEVPFVMTGGKEYNMEIIISSGNIVLSLFELKYPDYAGDTLKKHRDIAIKTINDNGFEDAQYAFTKFRNYNAFELSLPAQQVWRNGSVNAYSTDYRELGYQIDEWTCIGIRVDNNETAYREMLDSIQVS